MRESNCAGIYYQRGETLLKEEIEAAYHHERGPGDLPIKKQDSNTLAIIAPNSPYSHCAPCAAWAYKEIAETETPDLYIILSANHHTVESGLTTETFETPLGMVRVDQEFARALVGKGTIGYDDEIHNNDHGIEVQLPYLQFVKQKEIEKIKILPIIISNDIDLNKLAIDIKEVLLEQNKKAIIIVSSDFLRHGPMFHYVRFLDNTIKQIYDFDAKVIDLIKAQNEDAFFSFVDKNLAPIDGTIPIILMLKLLKKCNVQLEQYYVSAEILNEQKNSVSYGAIVFKE